MRKKHTRNAVIYIIFPIVIHTWVLEYILNPNKQSIISTGNPIFMRGKHGKLLLNWPPYYRIFDKNKFSLPAMVFLIKKMPKMASLLWYF